MGRQLVVGDIHGNYEALKQCLERSEFNYEEDKLIVLGDIVDGFSQTYEVVEELLKIKNIVFILGNHDDWFVNYLLKGQATGGWLHQGGIATVNSYLRHAGKDELKLKSRLSHANYTKDYHKLLNELIIPVTHQEFFNNAVLFHEEDGNLFVHAGFNDDKPMHLQNRQTLLWDRDLIETSRNRDIKGYSKVFIGHTTTQQYGGDGYILPRTFGNLTMMDTGAGWNGKLTIMCVESGAFWQSDKLEGH